MTLTISYLSPGPAEVKHQPLDAQERQAVAEAIRAGRFTRIRQGEVEEIERWRSTHRNRRQWAYQGVR